MQEFDERDFSFRSMVSDIFPDTQSARLARQWDVNLRTAQKWLAGEAQVPENVVAWVEHQRALLNPLDFQDIEKIIDKLGEAGLEREVIAAHLSIVYEKLTGIKIR